MITKSKPTVPAATPLVMVLSAVIFVIMALPASAQEVIAKPVANNSLLIAQAPSGSSQAPSGNSETIKDSNEVTPFMVRENYFKRFPYAKDAFLHDKLEKVEGGNSTTEGGKGSVSNLKKSAGPGHRTPIVYQFVIRYCNELWEYRCPGHPPLSPYCYYQPCIVADDYVKTKRDEELFDTALTGLTGLPLSDTQFQILDRENKQRFLELLFDPERYMWLAVNTGQMQGAALANSEAGASETSFDNAFERVRNENLINVANENAAVPTSASNPDKTIPQAVWMVQQMWKFVFLPMAILFLLPGAVLSQVQSFVHKGMMAETTMPFEGILRAIIAIFLIPATQLFVSYSIDIGNTMANSVKDWVTQEVVFNWAHEQSYNVPPKTNVVNYIKPPKPANTSSGLNAPTAGPGGSSGNISEGEGAGDRGKADQVSEKKTIQEDQLWLSEVMQLAFNAAIHGFSYAVITLTAFQLVFMCYLFLLGPLSACFFAWPALQGSQSLFRNVFSKWLDSVIVLSLWRFYWMVILAVMTQRIIWLGQSGNLFVDSQFEMMVLACFLGLMIYIPFAPFNFAPGAAVSGVLQQGANITQQLSQNIHQAGAAMGVPESTLQQITSPMDQAAGKMATVGGELVADQDRQSIMRGEFVGAGQQGFGGSGAFGGSGGSDASTQSPGAPSTQGGPPPVGQLGSFSAQDMNRNYVGPPDASTSSATASSGSSQQTQQAPPTLQGQQTASPGLFSILSQGLIQAYQSAGVQNAIIPPQNAPPIVPPYPQPTTLTGAPATGQPQPAVMGTNSQVDHKTTAQCGQKSIQLAELSGLPVRPLGQPSQSPGQLQSPPSPTPNVAPPSPTPNVAPPSPPQPTQNSKLIPPTDPNNDNRPPSKNA